MYKNKKNNLDERQENKLLHIERNGCWFAFWGLIVAIFVQMLMSGEYLPERLAGEWIVFMCLAVYISGSCIKNGIWDRKLKPDSKTNFVVSLIGGAAAGVIFGATNYTKFGFLEGAIWTGIINFFFVAIICFIGLSLVAAVYKKRLQKMEEQYKE